MANISKAAKYAEQKLVIYVDALWVFGIKMFP